MPPRLVLRSPSELVAALPHLLGYVPGPGLVLLAHVPDGVHGREVVGPVVRADLPAPAQLRRDIAPAVVDALLDHALSVGPAAVSAVVHGAGWDALRVAADVEVLRAVVDALPPDVGARATLRVADGRVGDPVCGRPCCPPDGVPLDPGSPHDLRVAHALTLSGSAPATSREELVARVEPAPAAALARVRAVGRDPVDAALARSGDLTALGRRLSALLRDQVRAAALRGASVDDRATARLLAGAEVPEVRDALLEALAAAHEASAALEVVLHLLRHADVGRAAPAGVLAAAAALLTGSGVLARAALDRALADAPEDPTALLLELVASRVQRPADVRRALSLPGAPPVARRRARAAGARGGTARRGASGRG